MRTPTRAILNGSAVPSCHLYLEPEMDETHPVQLQQKRSKGKQVQIDKKLDLFTD